MTNFVVLTNLFLQCSHDLPDVNIIAATPIHTAEKVPFAPNLFRTQHDVLEEESVEGDLV